MADVLAEGDWSPERLRRVSDLVVRLYQIVAELNEEFEAEKKRFTPDGVMVGHLGEVLAATIFDLKLLPSSTKGHDAVTRDGKLVQIKMTGGNRSVAFRREPDYLVVLQYYRGELRLIYNGEGHAVWQEFDGKPLPSNGQYSIALSRLRVLNELAGGRLPQIREIPRIGRL